MASYNMLNSNRSLFNGGDQSRTHHSALKNNQTSYNCSLVPTEILENLRHAFQNLTCSLNSRLYQINQTEFNKVINSLGCYQSTFTVSSFLKWILERGESSSMQLSHSTVLDVTNQASIQLVCFVIATESHQVLGKMVIHNPEKKLIILKSFHSSLDGNSTLTNLLKNMHRLSSASIRDQYRVPTQHKKLAEVFISSATSIRHHIFGVVTAVSKIPTAPVPPKKYWHSIVCISDPSLTSETSDLATSFKMHLFMISQEDYPEIHRGDVIRLTNVKVELEVKHQKNLYDGRIFKKEELTVYCYWDIDSQVPRENNEERAAVVRVLSRWWTLNCQQFDDLKPRPIYHTNSKYPGERCLREISNQFVCDIYCQVTNVSDDSSELKFLYVMDGTIFTTLDEPSKKRDQPQGDSSQLLKPSYGYLALVVFDNDYWKKISPLKITVGDFLLMKEVRVVFCEKEHFEILGSAYPFKYPCVLLRPPLHHDNGPKKIRKIPYNSHEAAKIRHRNHRLPEALEEMLMWQAPEAAEEEEVQVDLFLAKLNDPQVQLQILSKLKR